MILSGIFESTYESLARVDLLDPRGLLRASGLVVLDEIEDQTSDLLEARFVLSEQGLAGFRREIEGLVADPPGDLPVRVEAYAHNRDFLVDLRIIHNCYRQRSELIFDEDRWNRPLDGSLNPGPCLTNRVRAGWQRIRDRLEMTPNGSAFPGVRMMREYTLGEEEMVIVIHLIFKELYEGNAYADVAELLKLVSHDEAELIQNRRLVDNGSPLVTGEILCIEPMLEGRMLTGEAHLSDWVINYLFGATTPDETIHPDERIDWHMYLAQLDDTQGFYRELDSN